MYRNGQKNTLKLRHIKKGKNYEYKIIPDKS